MTGQLFLMILISKHLIKVNSNSGFPRNGRALQNPSFNPIIQKKKKKNHQSTKSCTWLGHSVTACNENLIHLPYIKRSSQYQCL